MTNIANDTDGVSSSGSVFNGGLRDKFAIIFESKKDN